MINAGGGASSSNAGGLNDGARRMCIGLGVRAFVFGTPPLRCAVGGRGNVGRCSAGAAWASFKLLFAALRAFMAGYTTGELRRRAAPGQPQSYKWVPLTPDSGDVYAGREMFACVALHERMWNGESMEISKWRRFVGSF